MPGLEWCFEERNTTRENCKWTTSYQMSVWILTIKTAEKENGAGKQAGIEIVRKFHVGTNPIFV